MSASADEGATPDDHRDGRDVLEGPDGHESLRLLSLVERTLTQRLEEALRSRGASLDQWRILSLLVDRGGCPMTVVADHVLLLAPKLSKLVDRMVAANLVLRRRDHEDRRRVLIVASARGRRALAEWDEATGEIRRQYRELLGPDAQRFEAVLRRLRDGIEPAGAEPAEPTEPTAPDPAVHPAG